jgi:fatty-acyl-CoA synthase
MNGLMMQKQLLISSLIVHADRHHGDTEIVSRRVEGDIHRYTFRDCHRRARQMANALTSLDVSSKVYAESPVASRLEIVNQLEMRLAVQ